MPEKPIEFVLSLLLVLALGVALGFLGSLSLLSIPCQ